MYKFACSVFLSLMLSVTTRYSGAMPTKGILDGLCSGELGSYLNENFDGDAGPTLHKMMYAGQRTDDWTEAASGVAAFLTKLRQCAAKDEAGAQLSGDSRLETWLRSINSKEGLSDILFGPYKEDTSRMQERLSEALKLLEKKDYVCLQNVNTKSVKFVNSKIEINKQILNPIYGPDSLDAALFMADLFMMYEKQVGVLEHGVQYKCVETAQSFGKTLSDELAKQELSEADIQRWWSNVSLLAGWESLRRFVTKDNVDEILSRPEHDPRAVTEVGLRLIGNKNIKNPVFLINVALAMLH